MTAFARLTQSPVVTLHADGAEFDLAAPDQASVCFHEMASGLSKISRFDGRNRGIGLSVAQHCSMGAQAIINEGGTRFEAALFLLHDGHEWALGDITTPVQKLIALVGGMPDVVRASIASCKAAWDEAIYAAANLPAPSVWDKKTLAKIHAMDARMCREEAITLFGSKAAKQFKRTTKPETTGSLTPWGAMRAEEEFLKQAYKLLGKDIVVSQAAIAAAARALR